MKRIREHFLSNKMLYRMFGSFALLSIVLLPIMTSFLYGTFQRSLEKEIYQTQQKNLELITNAVDFRAEYADSLMQTARSDKDISTLFYKEEDEDTLIALEALSHLRLGVKQLHSIYIYNQTNGKVYYSSGMTPYSSCALEQFGDDRFVEIVESIDQYPKYAPYTRYLTEEKPNGQHIGEYVYTYLVFDVYSNGSIKNIMAFNFHMGWMGDALDFIREDQNSSILIVNRNREVLYSESKELVGTTVDRALLPDQVFSEPAGYTILESAGDRQMLVYATPTHQGYDQWTFLSWIDYDEITAPMEQVSMISGTISFVFLVIFLVLSAMVSGRLYAPVKQTIERVHSLQNEQTRRKELERKLVLRRLFRGELPETPSRLEKILRETGIDMSSYSISRVLVVAIDNQSRFRNRFRTKYSEATEAIERIICTNVGAEFDSFLSSDLKNGHWGVCIPASDISQTVMIERVFQGINHSLKEMDLSVSIAVSQFGLSASDIPFLYAEALDMLSFRFMLGHNSLILPAHTEEFGKGRYEYPLKQEQKLISSLFGGKRQEAYDAYAEFMEAISSFAIYDMRMAFTILANSVKRGANNAIPEIPSQLREMEKLYQKIQELETLDEVNQLFRGLFDTIIDKTQDYALQKHRQVVERMQEYVTQNYGCISLSMNEVADHVDMSAAYIGRMFKQVTGTTFTEYLTQYRLSKACDALTNTDKTVNEISDEVGFTNSSYFYIVFKKKMGCTPNQYRKQRECDQ